MAESRRQGHHQHHHHLSSTPSTASELQLYRVLERANLAPYYANFIHQGGDDVQQLCEAGEDEFLEIMSLVGMGSKPLHVRRLQKALQDWVANPGAFQEPLPAQQVHHSQIGNMDVPLAMNLHPHGSHPNVHHAGGRWQQANNPGSSPSHAPSSSGGTPARSSPGTSQQGGGSSTTPPSFRAAGNLSSPSPAAFSSAPIGRPDNPVLSRETVENIRVAAEQLVRTGGITPLPLNKKVTKEVEYILTMSPDHPNRMEEIRKWSSIYGRFDSKRKLDKPLTLHEVTVNEAAAQLCNLDPHLIMQRDKLFPQARQVVRDSGYQFRHGHSRAGKSKGSHKKSKRAKLAAEAELNPNPRTVQAEIMKIRREERMNEITSLLNNIKTQQYDLKAKIAIAKAEDNLQKVYDLQLELEKLTTQQLAYMTEQTDLIKKQKRSDRYYVAKAKAEGREDDDEDESLLHDDSGNLLHEDQQQQQQPPPQQQPQQQTHQQHHQQQQQQQPPLPQHMAGQQPHHDRRSKCSSPHMKQEDCYSQGSSPLEHQQPLQQPQYSHNNNPSPRNPQHAHNHHHHHHHGSSSSSQPGDAAPSSRRAAKSQQASSSHATRGSPQPHPPPTSQHYSPLPAAAIDVSSGGVVGNSHYPPAGQASQDAAGAADSQDMSHSGPKRAAFKAQRQMMQHLLMDEGYRLAQTFGTYQPPNLHFPPPPGMGDPSHTSHLLEQQQLVNLHPHHMAMLHP